MRSAAGSLIRMIRSKSCAVKFRLSWRHMATILSAGGTWFSASVPSAPIPEMLNFWSSCMELAELMQSFQESMKAAKKDSEARAASRTAPKAAPKPAPKRGRPPKDLKGRVLAPSDSADSKPLTTAWGSDPGTRKRDPSRNREHSTPMKKGKPKGDRSPPRENLQLSPRRRTRLRRVDEARIGHGHEGDEGDDGGEFIHEFIDKSTGKSVDAKEGKVTRKVVKVFKLVPDSNLDQDLTKNLLLKRPADTVQPVPAKRSARLASETSTVSQVSKMHTPRPFDGKHKGREDAEKEKTFYETSQTSHQNETNETNETNDTNEMNETNESEIDAADAADAAGEGCEEPTTSAAATAVSGEGSEELRRQLHHQESMVKFSEKLELPDPPDCWRKLAGLMKQLPKRCNDNFVHDDSEVASFLEAAARCVCGEFVDDLGISYIRLTAANSLLDLAAAVCDESEELAGTITSIMTTSIATRCVLNVVAQQISRVDSVDSVDLLRLLNLEPVPTVEHLTKFCAHLDDLFAKSSLRKLNNSSFDVMQKCCSLARRDDKDPRNLEVAICRPAACAVLALGKILAMEAADAEAENLVLLEARARVRAASKAAAERVAGQLSQEFEAQQQRCARAAVAAAADEAQKEVQELGNLNAEICQGRHVLESWAAEAAMLKAQAVPVEIWGRPVDVSAADWVRMNDGQHLNDSLIDLFVSMLVAHPVQGTVIRKMVDFR
eukprot:s1080_g20.t1